MDMAMKLVEADRDLIAGLGAGAIAVIVIAVVALLVAVIAVVVIRKKRQSFAASTAQVDL